MLEDTSILFMQPDARHPKIEFFDTVEELFQIVGDTTLRNSGRMDSGSYFWRPPYITHRPFSSEQGGIMYLYTDCKLVNYFTDDPEQPPAANVAQAQREREESQHG